MVKLALFCEAISILCSLLTAIDIPTDPKFNPEKLSGKWYPLLTGSYHQPPPEHVFAVRPKALTNGAFSANIEKPVNGTCQVVKYDFKPVRPGSFQTEDGKVFFLIIETDYNSYLISVFKMGKIYILQLLAKKTKVSSKWRKKFNNYAKKLRFNSGEVQDFSHAALCGPPPKKKT